MIDVASKDHPQYLGTSSTVGSESFLDANAGFVKVWQQTQREGTKLAKANWDDYLDFAGKVGGFAPEIGPKPRRCAANCPTSPSPTRGWPCWRAPRSSW